VNTVSFDRQPILTGDLLELRPLRADDFDALFRVAADPLIWDQHPERDRFQEATFRTFFEEALSSGGALVAIDRATGHIIGSSRYHGYDANCSVIEIGWTFLARAYWGGQYNGQMKRLMLEHAFRSVNRVIFIIGPDNRRSQRAVEKIGGVRAGTTTNANGQERVVYELTPERYAGKQEPGAASRAARNDQDMIRDVSIRIAGLSDLEAITEIYNEAILTTTATFDTEPKEASDRLEWFRAHGDRHPILVALFDQRVIGWGSISKWSDRQAYDGTGETSLYVKSENRGQGVGHKLMHAMIFEATRLGFHSLIARIADGSDASVHLHKSYGFVHIGTLKEVGRKFGKLLDVHILQRIL
jgi:L-amino acid N-acyltransferase YncA